MDFIATFTVSKRYPLVYHHTFNVKTEKGIRKEQPTRYEKVPPDLAAEEAITLSQLFQYRLLRFLDRGQFLRTATKYYVFVACHGFLSAMLIPLMLLGSECDYAQRVTGRWIGVTLMRM